MCFQTCEFEKVGKEWQYLGIYNVSMNSLSTVYGDFIYELLQSKFFSVLLKL